MSLQQKHIVSLFAFVLFLAFAMAAKTLLENRPDHISRFPGLKPNQAQYVAQSLQKYSFGFENLISGLLWVQTLQESDHTPLKNDEVSWEFGMLDAVTELDPRFEQSYEFGSIFLSALRKDKIGGTRILEKWVHRHPAYWRPSYLLASHLYLNMGNKEAAGPLLLRAAQMRNAPDWLNSLGIRLLSDTGAKLQAYQQAISVWPFLKHPEGKIRLGTRIRSLNYNIQKEAWNDALTMFREKYHKEPRSLLDLEGLQGTLNRTVASVDSKTVEEDSVLKFLVSERFAFRYDPKSKTIVAQNGSDEKELGKIGSYELPQLKEK